MSSAYCTKIQYLSLFCYPVCLLLPSVLISLHTLQEMTMTCVFKPGKVAAAGRKLFALRFLFLSSPYVLLKLSDFFLFVSLISLLHTIFMRMITRQCNSYFWNIFLASWRESPKRLKTFDGRREIWYAFPYCLLMQKQMRVKLMIVLGLVDWRALVSSLKEELTQP